MLPIDLILVRHGQSEGNVANKTSRSGDNHFFTEEFRNRHSRTFRLTDSGIAEAKAAGVWLKANLPMPMDRFYVSDYIRAMETAALLDLPGALWRREFHLRERDMGLQDNLPDDERKILYPKESQQYAQNKFLSIPAGGGESIASLCLRLKTAMLEHWARECSDKRVIAVCHGHVMRALQVEIEDLLPERFIELDESEDNKDKIRNCQIFWYTRRDPETNALAPHIVAMRSICPWDSNGDFGWRKILHKRWSSEELMAEVQKQKRNIS